MSKNLPFYVNALLLKLPSCFCFSRHFKWHLSKGSFWSASEANSVSLQWWHTRNDPNPIRSYVTSPDDFGDRFGSIQKGKSAPVTLVWLLSVEIICLLGTTSICSEDEMG